MKNNDQSAKNILVTGYPGTGKTTLIRNVYERLPGLKVSGFYTVEMREQGVRVGFQAVRLDGPAAVFAHTRYRTPPERRVGKYGVRPEVLEELVLPYLESAGSEAQLVIIDEIAKMELLSEGFRAAVKSLLDSACPILATVSLKGTGFIKQVKERRDVELFTLTEKNRKAQEEHILRTLRRLFM
jgi:nucleoside-triphosphatase